MKLGEALAARADMHSRQDQLIKAIGNNARYQEGEVPPEDAKVLLTESLKLADEIAVLCTKINMTNSVTVLGDGTITGALARRDALRAKQKIMNDALKATAADPYGYGGRHTRSELVDVIAFEVPAIRQALTVVTTELRALDNEIQQIGWATELQE
jgi:hypothetical protein